MLRPVSGGLRSVVQVRRESVRVEFRVPPGVTVATDDDGLADDLVASGDFVEPDPTPLGVVEGDDVKPKRGPGSPRKG
jgi:hypothetical protein